MRCSSHPHDGPTTRGPVLFPCDGVCGVCVCMAEGGVRSISLPVVTQPALTLGPRTLTSHGDYGASTSIWKEGL